MNESIDIGKQDHDQKLSSKNNNMDNYDDNDDLNRNNQLILHVMVIGFHHKKGCLIDYCYPPLKKSNRKISPTNCDSNETSNYDKSDDDDQEKLEQIELPEEWKSLPSLAVPDGAHNFDRDTVFFHLPDLNNLNKTIYCVACYQQIATEELLVRTPDMTRCSVQKSVVALLKIPLYGFVEQKLRIVTQSYFNELDFSKTEILKEFYHLMSMQLDYSMIRSDEIFNGLSLRKLFSRYGPQVIVLFKLLLLEKKVLFISSPIRELCGLILSLCSLFPGLIQDGMTQVHLPVRKYSEIQDDESTMTTESETTPTTANVTDTYCDKNENLIESNQYDNDKQKNSESQIDFSLASSTISSYDDLEKDEDDDYEDEDENLSFGEENIGKKSGQIFDRQNCFQEFLKQPYEHYGLPLNLFKCNSYCLPYCSISCFEQLNNEIVRSCLAGSSNTVFLRWENDFDVFVVEKQIIIKDEKLRKILTPTVEDLRFMSFLLNEMNINPSNDPESRSSISSQGSSIFYLENDQKISISPLECESSRMDHLNFYEKYKGSDIWCRYHYYNYILHMLRCSISDESSKEYRSFNAGFLSEWKTTYNYKCWMNIPKIFEIFLNEINPQHTFASNRLNDIRFKISNFLSNRHENINSASKVVLNTAKSALNSFVLSLGTYQTGLAYQDTKIDASNPITRAAAGPLFDATDDYDNQSQTIRSSSSSSSSLSSSAASLKSSDKKIDIKATFKDRFKSTKKMKPEKHRKKDCGNNDDGDLEEQETSV